MTRLTSRRSWRRILLAVLGWTLTLQPAAPAAVQLHPVLPVTGKVAYGKAHHDYPATDIFAACGRTVLSPVRGTVLEVNRVDRWDPATNKGGARGGKFVSIRGVDGVRYYGSHFSGIRKEIRPGLHLRAAQRLGWVGHTGSARYTPCHLHFGLSPVCKGSGQWWIRRGVVSPYRYLRSWQDGGHRSPATQVSTWKREHGCPSGP